MEKLTAVVFPFTLNRDHDDETSVLDAVSRLNEVKGMRGLGRYFKQVAQSARAVGVGVGGGGSASQDDFLGSVNVRVCDIPSTGTEMWYKLEGRSAKSNIQGSIRLRLWLSTREDRGLSEEEDMWNEIRQQENIYSIFTEHQLKLQVSTYLQYLLGLANTEIVRNGATMCFMCFMASRHKGNSCFGLTIFFAEEQHRCT